MYFLIAPIAIVEVYFPPCSFLPCRSFDVPLDVPSGRGGGGGLYIYIYTYIYIYIYIEREREIHTYVYMLCTCSDVASYFIGSCVRLLLSIVMDRKQRSLYEEFSRLARD